MSANYDIQNKTTLEIVDYSSLRPPGKLGSTYRTKRAFVSG